MARTIVIHRMGWTTRFPRTMRADLIRLVFSLAAQHGWNVVMAHQHWPGNAAPPARTTKELLQPMTDARWAQLMGHRPE